MQHIKSCNLNEKGYAKVVKKLNKIVQTGPTTDQLVETFAKQCYGRKPDRKLANSQAKVFLEAVYGSIDDILDVGPDVAAYINVFGLNRKLNQWTGKFMHYRIGYELGRGITSEVKIALNLQSNKKVALKIMEPQKKNVKKYAKNEVNILKQLHHENIVKVYESFENAPFDPYGRKTVISIEYVQHGELIDYLIYTPKFGDELARWFFTSLVEGVEYCHSRKIIHRDLKHDNCLLSKNFILKITDFGFATHYSGKVMKTSIGTEQYAAPEILEGKEYTDSVDIFSMGVMLFIALAGTMPWRMADYKKDKWYRWVHKRRWKEFFEYHKRSHTFTIDQIAILTGILEPDPEKRWTLKDIQRCRWYRGRKNDQKEVSHIMRKRKRSVEKKKFNQMQTKLPQKRRGLYIKKWPNVYFQPIPLLSFITDKRADWALEDIENAITEIKGVPLPRNENDEANYRLNFYVRKYVDTSRYESKETKKKLWDIVDVKATVQMWTLPGQKETIVEIEKAFATVSKTSKKASIEELKNKFPDIKSVAVFRATGTSEEKYLFPKIFSDILVKLPAHIISKDVLSDDDLKEEEDVNDLVSPVL